MSRTLELPNGDVVSSEDVFLYNNYPYRVKFPESESSTDDAADCAFWLSPLYWGGGEMDVPFEERAALVEQWGPESRGLLTAEEWEEWLERARDDDRFDDAELDALARELTAGDEGLVDHIRGLFED